VAPATFEAVADRNAGLIRKALKGTVLLGKYAGSSPAAAITTLVATGGQIEIPSTYESCGWIGEDGATFTKNTENSEIRGWGSAAVLRRDITSEDNTVQFTALETKRLTLELKHRRDLSTTEVSAAGELKIDLLDRPDTMYWRVCTLAKDGVGSGLIYFAKVFHKAMVSEMGDEVWSDGDQAITYDTTMTGEPDDVLGTIGTEFMFGPGMLARATEMGFTVAT